MSLIVNGTEIESIIYNGVELETLIFNGITVWEKNTGPSVEDLLIDFEYTVSGGIYTITGWKGTYNGEPSTMFIVPDHSSIRV